MTIYNDETGNSPESSTIKQYMELKKQEEKAKQYLLNLNEILDNEATRLLESAQAINNVLDSFLEYVDTLANTPVAETILPSQNTAPSTLNMSKEDLKQETEELRVIRELIEIDYQKKQKALEDRDISIQIITDMITLMTAKRYRFIGEISALMDRIKELEEETRIYYAILYLQENEQKPFQITSETSLQSY